MLDTVRALVARHVGQGVADTHYANVGAALLWTIEQGLRGACMPAARGAWAAAHVLLSDGMLEAAQAVLDATPGRMAVTSIGSAHAAG